MSFVYELIDGKGNVCTTVSSVLDISEAWHRWDYQGDRGIGHFRACDPQENIAYVRKVSVEQPAGPQSLLRFDPDTGCYLPKVREGANRLAGERMGLVAYGSYRASRKK